MKRRVHQVMVSDLGLSVLLVGLVAILFVIFPFVEIRGPGRLLLDVTITLVLLSGSQSLADRRPLFFVSLALAALALITQWLGHFVDTPAVLVWNRVCTLLFLSFNAA